MGPPKNNRLIFLRNLHKILCKLHKIIEWLFANTRLRPLYRESIRIVGEIYAGRTLIFFLRRFTR